MSALRSNPSIERMSDRLRRPVAAHVKRSAPEDSVVVIDNIRTLLAQSPT